MCDLYKYLLICCVLRDKQVQPLNNSILQREWVLSLFHKSDFMLERRGLIIYLEKCVHKCLIEMLHLHVALERNITVAN